MLPNNKYSIILKLLLLIQSILTQKKKKHAKKHANE